MCKDSMWRKIWCSNYNLWEILCSIFKFLTEYNFFIDNNSKPYKIQKFLMPINCSKRAKILNNLVYLSIGEIVDFFASIRI